MQYCIVCNFNLSIQHCYPKYTCICTNTQISHWINEALHMHFDFLPAYLKTDHIFLLARFGKHIKVKTKIEAKNWFWKLSLKSGIQETLNILMCAKSRTTTKKQIVFWWVGGVRGGEGQGWDNISAWLRGDNTQTHR